MRTIGRKNIAELKEIVNQEFSKIPKYSMMSGATIQTLESRVMNRVPEAWYDTWESAHTEITRIIYDELTQLIYVRR